MGAEDLFKRPGDLTQRRSNADLIDDMRHQVVLGLSDRLQRPERTLDLLGVASLLQTAYTLDLASLTVRIKLHDLRFGRLLDLIDVDADHLELTRVDVFLVAVGGV